MDSSSRMVLLKGVDKQGFVWYVKNHHFKQLSIHSSEPPYNFITHAFIGSCAGTQITVAKKHMIYRKIQMRHFFSTGMR